MSTRSDVAYLKHIRDPIAAVEEYTAPGKATFMASRMVQDAVIRNLEVIGEAVKGLSAETKERAPGVPWRRIAGMRDQLIHHYFGVDHEVVWRVVEGELVTLRDEVARLLMPDGTGSSTSGC